MTTNYPGREAKHDLGGGSSFVWMSNRDGDTIGLIEHHPATAKNAARGHKYCGGYIAWAPDPGHPHTAVRHQLVSGGPGDEEHLTVTPSLLCQSCGHHGFITNGRWVPA